MRRHVWSARYTTPSELTIPVVLLLVIGIGVGLLWWGIASGMGPAPMSAEGKGLLHGAAIVLCLSVCLAWSRFQNRRVELMSAVTVVVVSLFAAGGLLMVLSGTPYGLYGLFGDQVFRSQAVTRFAHNLANVDHAYKGLPGHYTPLVLWFEGRVSDLLGVPAWKVIKYGAVLLAAGVPVLAYVAWRRLVAPPVAAAITAVATLFVADLYKPDQWLVLAVVLPWWLDAFRGCTREDRRTLPLWLHGVLAGVLLTGYTFYFIPLAIATLAGLIIDLRSGRGVLETLRRPLVIVAVGLVVSAWYWLPILRLRLQGASMESYQTGWFVERHAEVTSPLDHGGFGLLLLAGLVYLVVDSRQRLTQSLLLAVIAGGLLQGLGLIATAAGHGMLIFKAVDYLHYCLLAASVLGIVHAVRVVQRRIPSGRRDVSASRLAVVAVGVICLSGAVELTSTWLTGPPVNRAHASRLPDGSVTQHGAAAAELTGRRLGSAADTAAILRALGVGSDEDPVILTRDKALAATTTVHPFVMWSRSYSNPFSEFDGRVSVVRRLSRAGPDRLVEIAERNPYDGIDGFVLDKVDAHTWRFDVSDYERPSSGPYDFGPEQFDHPNWRTTELEDVVVITSLRS